ICQRAEAAPECAGEGGKASAWLLGWATLSLDRGREQGKATLAGSCPRGQAKARRKSGSDVASTRKKSPKILLTENDRLRILRHAPVTASPQETFRRFLSYPHAGKISQRGVSVSVHMEKPAISSLEMDREVIRCKTCGLVQYRTRTGNCRRCVRALPQRLEFLIPPAAAPEEAAAETASEKFANQETAENIGQRIRQLR